jgi:hypothetical protein
LEEEKKSNHEEKIFEKFMKSAHTFKNFEYDKKRIELLNR